MKIVARLRPALLALALVVMAGLAHAGLEEGLNALRRSDYARAAKELRPVAEAGNAEAQYRIGRMYEFGAGYPKDVAQGVAWYRKAAAQGHAEAMEQLGEVYATGDGIPKDDAQAAAWFRKAAEAGNAAAQYNIGLYYAKGAGVKKDIAQAIAWLRKSAAQGMRIAQFKLGVAYENGEGVTRDAALAYANYAIAAQDGNAEYAQYRDDIGKSLSPAQRAQAQATADAWRAGSPMPTVLAAAPSGAAARGAPAAKVGPDRCSASGAMEGEKFSLPHCAVSLMQDAHSIAIWFNEAPIAPDEAASFQTSSYAADDKGGKPRTKLVAMFCPGGGGAAASAGKLTKIDLNTNHAKAPMAGVQTVLDAPKDFKVEKLAGTVEPGAALSGRIVVARGKTSFTLDFDVTLPAKDAAAGLACK